MAERLHPPPPTSATAADLVAMQELLPSSKHTYIIQLPKEQVYRVPPEENAEIAARYRLPREKKRRWTPCACYATAAFIVAIFLAITITLIYKLTLSPENPAFTVSDFSVKENARSTVAKKHNAPTYTLTFQVNNPNSLNSMAYLTSPAELQHGASSVATGQTPAVSQAVKGIDKFHVALIGRSSGVPKAIKESMGGKRSMKMGIVMNLRIHKKTWLMTKKDVVRVRCEFVVRSRAHRSESPVKSQTCYYL